MKPILIHKSTLDLIQYEEKIMRVLKDPRVLFENKPAEREIWMKKSQKKYPKLSEPNKEDKFFTVLESLVLQSERTV